MFERFKHQLYEADKGGAGSSDAGGKGSEGQGGSKDTDEPLVWETWFDKQPDPIKSAIAAHTTGLKSALDSEREARKTAERQIRELAAKAEKGSETEKQLTAMANSFSEADRKAGFYEDAHAAGVTNLKLAYLSAMADERFDRHGRVDFAALKKDYPELFGAGRPPKGNAGEGSGSPGAGAPNMNSWIRKAAGRT